MDELNYKTENNDICIFSDDGFIICEIFQETPLLKEFCDKEGRKISDISSIGNFIFVRGFREEMLKNSQYRPFLYNGLKIPREFEPFFSIISPKLNDLIFRIEHLHTNTPFEDEIQILKPDNTDTPFFDHQARYISSGVKLIEKISKSEIKDSFNLLIDAWSILAEFYQLEGRLLASNRDEAFFSNLPKSGLCLKCLEPMEDPKDGRSSEICKKCRRDIKITKQRVNRRKNWKERHCACGCGEIFLGRPNKIFVNDTHGRRKQKR